MSREKTDSITHLVKIVAREEIRSYLVDRHSPAAEEVARSHRKLSERLDELGERFMGDIQTSLERAGGTWLKEEDTLLVQEVRTALAQIAKNHARSIVAIRSRINYRELI
jgi:hypothetical protein